MTPAEHIFTWVRNDAVRNAELQAARSYPEGANFTGHRAYRLLCVSTNAYRDMRKAGDMPEPYLARDILEASLLMALWDGES